MNTLLSTLLLVVGIGLLVKGADWLVAGSSNLARRFGVSDLVIGLTIVAFGTSTPEMVVSLFAAGRGNPDICVGNVLGSNIANVLLILGVAAVIYPLSAATSTVRKEIPFVLLASIVLAVEMNDLWIDGASASVISRSDGIVLVSFFAIFLFYIAQVIASSPGTVEASIVQRMSGGRAALSVVVGLGVLIGGGQLVVQNAVLIAQRLGASEYLIGATVIAVGTSLPELATSAVAAFRKNSDIAIGNVVGSNIFNILFILGVSGLITPLPVAPGRNGDLLVILLSTVLLFAVMYTGAPRHQIQRIEGALFLLLYGGYVGWLIVSG